MRKTTCDEPDTLIDLADVTLYLARKLSSYHFQNPAIVPLSTLERLVLMHLERNPGLSCRTIWRCAPRTPVLRCAA